jgi:hypothetical protein
MLFIYLNAAMVVGHFTQNFKTHFSEISENKIYKTGLIRTYEYLMTPLPIEVPIFQILCHSIRMCT